MHDEVGRAADEIPVASTSQTQQQQNSGTSHWQSSYQAQTSGQQAGAGAKRGGKKCFNPAQPARPMGGTGSFFTGGTIAQRSDVVSVPADLVLGTTRATNLVPG